VVLLEGVIDITLLMIAAEERRLVHENNFFYRVENAG